MTAYLVPLPWTNPPLSGNRTRGNPHARANEVKHAKEQAQWAIRAARLPRLAGAELTLCFRVATKHRRDADNLAPTLKVVQDALVAEGVLHDDSWVCVPSATCRILPPNGDGAAMWLEIHGLGAIA
jgi:Holliday junction resolvase RusA-like endonuclease